MSLTQQYLAMFDRKLTNNVLYYDALSPRLMGDPNVEIPEEMRDEVRILAHRDAKYVGANHYEFPEGYAFPEPIQAWLDHKPYNASMPEGLEFGTDKENKDE